MHCVSNWPFCPPSILCSITFKSNLLSHPTCKCPHSPGRLPQQGLFAQSSTLFPVPTRCYWTMQQPEWFCGHWSVITHHPLCLLLTWSWPFLVAILCGLTHNTTQPTQEGPSWSRAKLFTWHPPPPDSSLYPLLRCFLTNFRKSLKFYQFLTIGRACHEWIWKKNRCE